VIAAYHLKPLDLPETHEYITHRLTTAGWKGDPEFAPGIFEGVFQFTEGVPRRINTLCDRLLLYGYLEGLHAIDHKALRSVTEDIIEEHGGADDDVSGVVPEGAPELRVPIGGDDAGGVGPAGTRNGAGAAQTERLSAVEQSVAGLASTLQKEMALLREALLEQTRGGRGGSDKRDDTGKDGGQ
jgi:hypothetical protein